MTTLSVAVDADDKLWTIDTMPDSPFLEAGSELVEISARFPEHVYKPTMETIPDRIRVVRARAGTTAASHAQGITLTPVYPESATAVGGAGVTVDNQSDPPAEVTTLVVPGATIAGDEADLSSVVTVLRTTVTLNDAQIKALPTTPVAVIPAGGAGTVIIPFHAVLYFDWTADYTNVEPTAFLGIDYDSSFGSALARLDEASFATVSDFFAPGEDVVAFIPSFGQVQAANTFGWYQLAGDVVNQGIAIRIFNALAGPLTGGNAANTINVTILYTVVTP